MGNRSGGDMSHARIASFAISRRLAWAVVVAAVLLLGVLGGTKGTGRAAGSSPPTKYKFTSSTRPPYATDEAESAVVGSVLYLFGGFNLNNRVYLYQPTARSFAYDSTTTKWRTIAPLPQALSHAGITTDGVRYIYFGGGYYSPTNTTADAFTGLDQVWRYDTVSNTYLQLASLPAPRGAGGMALVGSALYYFGGTNSGRTQDFGDAWALDISNPFATWAPIASMPNPRNHMGWSVINGQVYVVGGMHLTVASSAQGDLDRYDPPTDTWTVLAPLAYPRDHVMDSTFTDIYGRLVVVGGWGKNGISGLVSAYTPDSNSWINLTSLPLSRTSSSARGFPSGKYVDTDGSSPSIQPADGWVATPVG
jgi:N-acetylneuraminic acid mutarotase